MIDSVKKKPAFTTWKWLADFAVTGYMPFGILEVGRIDETVSWNEIEGVRPKLALRTTDALSEAFQLWGMQPMERKIATGNIWGEHFLTYLRATNVGITCSFLIKMTLGF